MDKILSIFKESVTAKGIRDSSDIKIRVVLTLQYLVLIAKVTAEQEEATCLSKPLVSHASDNFLNLL